MTSRTTQIVARLVPWAGWVGGFTGWALAHQIGSDLDQAHCALADPLLMVVIGLCGAALAGGGGWIALRHWRNSDHDISQTGAGATRFFALASGLAAGLFLLAIIFQTASSLIIPQCHT